MQDELKAVEALFASAAVKRKRGDALRRKNREPDARKAYREAIGIYESGLEELEKSGLLDPNLPSSEQVKVATLHVEGLGSKGGVHRRLGEYDEAVESYEKGAGLERRFRLSSTYNRVNFVKNSLQADQRRKGLDELQEQIRTIAKVLEEQLRTDTDLSDRGWAWADLGDCLALTGDIEGAATAYRTFIDKAPSRAPESTLAVLSGVADAIRDGDPEAAERLTRVVAALRVRLEDGVE